MKRILKPFLVTILACLMISGSALSASAACPENVISLDCSGNITCSGNIACSDITPLQGKDCTDLLSRICDSMNYVDCAGDTCKTFVIGLPGCSPTDAFVCPILTDNSRENDCANPSTENNCENDCAVPPTENNCENDCAVPPTETVVEQPAATEAPTNAPVTPSESYIPPTEPAAEPTEAPTNAVVQPTEAVPTPTEPAAYALNDYELEVVSLINEIRSRYGLGALSVDTDLSRVARIKSQDMHDRSYFSHTSPTYGSPFDMMDKFGIRYRTAGENIAMGYRSPQSVVDGWMNSEGHRKNILNGSFTRIGMGYVADGSYWTQMFIG